MPTDAHAHDAHAHDARAHDAHHHSEGHDHDHGHGHDHAHGHGVAEENYASRRHPEYVVLDIGGELGALIVHTDAHMVGVEVEISATGEDHRRTHKDVLEREINGRPAFTAVFDKVSEGGYTLWVDDVARAREVHVCGGSISELDWRYAAGRDSPQDQVPDRRVGSPPAVVHAHL
jgi:hypothetical protein